VAEMLLSKKVDVVVTSESLSGKGPGYALSEAGVELVETDLETVKDFIDEVIFSLRNPILQSSE
jgi:predicted Fe-Mo cluster-binding NifX family protein